MPLPHQNQAPEIKFSFGDDSAQKQRRQMLIALTLLLVALILILTKDREFWFPSAPVQSESEPLEETSPEPNSLEAVTTITQPAVPRRLKAKHAPRRQRPSQTNRPQRPPSLRAEPCSLRSKSRWWLGTSTAQSKQAAIR